MKVTFPEESLFSCSVDWFDWLHMLNSVPADAASTGTDVDRRVA